MLQRGGLKRMGSIDEPRRHHGIARAHRPGFAGGVHLRVWHIGWRRGPGTRRSPPGSISIYREANETLHARYQGFGSGRNEALAWADADLTFEEGSDQLTALCATLVFVKNDGRRHPICLQRRHAREHGQSPERI